jgi:hypothetical protein
MRQDIVGSHLAILNPAKHVGLIEHRKRFTELVSQFARGLLAAEAPTSPGVVNPLRADGRGGVPERDRNPTPTT